MLRLYRNHIQHFLTLSIHVLSLTLLPTSLILHIGTNSWSLLGRKLPLALAFFFGVVLTTVFQAAFPFSPRDWSLSMLPVCRIHIVNGLLTCRDCHCASLGVCGRSGIRTRDVLRFIRRLSKALSNQRLFQCCLRPLSHPSFFSCISCVFLRRLILVSSDHHTIPPLCSSQSDTLRKPIA